MCSVFHLKGVPFVNFRRSSMFPIWAWHWGPFRSQLTAGPSSQQITHVLNHLFLSFLNAAKKYATIHATKSCQNQLRKFLSSRYHSNHVTYVITLIPPHAILAYKVYPDPIIFELLPRPCHTRAYLDPVFSLRPWRHNTASDAGWWQWHRERTDSLLRASDP
jgi:hypothetical protein